MKCGNAFTTGHRTFAQQKKKYGTFVKEKG